MSVPGERKTFLAPSSSTELAYHIDADATMPRPAAAFLTDFAASELLKRLRVIAATLGHCEAMVARILSKIS